MQTGKYTLWDHNFQLAHRNLEATEFSRFNRSVNDDLEVFDFPGGYATRFDGVDKGGAEQTSNLQKIFEDNRRTAKLRMEEIDASCQVISGSSNCASLTAGHRFTLRDHPVPEMNSQHTLVSLRHEADQMPNYVSEQEYSDPYRNSFTCIPHGSGKAPYRPPSLARKPSVRGSQTAVVVGAPGEEIFVDKYGRVTTLTLKVGGNFINIDAGGIFIKGTMVMINSGGAAGSGSGARPETPKQPKEADKAEPGSLSRPLPPTPPLRATTFSPIALVMLHAAQSGVPFCEICQQE